MTALPIGKFVSALEENYKIKSRLGFGAFGTVYKCRQTKLVNLKEQDRIVAVKLVILQSEYTLHNAIEEVTFLKQLNHTNIVQVYKSWIENPPQGYSYPYLYRPIDTSEGVIFIETEYCDLNSLRLWFNQPWRNKDHAKIILYQITKGVVYLHERGIIHRDLKPENILLHRDKSSNSVVAKICDFGVSRAVQATMTSDRGTDGYKSPEVLQPGGKCNYSQKADVFSLGVTFYDMLILGALHNDGLSLKLDEMKYNPAGFTFIPEYEKHVLDQEKFLISRMVEKSEVERLDAHKIPYELAITYSLTASELEELKIPIPIIEEYESDPEEPSKELSVVITTEKATIEKNAITKYEKELIWFDIKAPTKFYKGRNKESKIIDDYWKDSLRDKEFILMGITGLGGIGKSELAKNFAKLFYTNYQGHCVWINAETNQTISDSIKRLAKKLRISVIDASGNEKSLEKLLPDIFEKLFSQKCLVILDNLENYEETLLVSLVEEAIGKEPTELKPFVITTSRNKLVSVTCGCYAKHIELKNLSEEAAIEFFREALAIKEEINEVMPNVKNFVTELCRKLDFFPLAMQQAAAYINAKKLNSDVATELKSFVDSFEKESKKLLSYSLPKMQSLGLNDSNRSTYLTWQITLDKIQKLPGVGSKTANVLNVISFFHSENISSEFIEKILEILFPDEESSENSSTSKKVKTDIFEILDIYSMCQITKKDSKSVISVHRLVQEVISIKLHEEDKFATFLNNLLECLNDILKTTEVPLSELIHLESLWGHASKNSILMDKYSDIADKIIQQYYDEGKYRRAYSFCSSSIITFSKAFGKENRGTLRMMYWEGDVLERLGEYERALEILNGIYEIQKNIFGESDDHSLRTAVRIAAVHWRQGNYPEAYRIFQNALEIRENVFGKQNEETIRTWNELAFVFHSQGKLDDALGLWGKVLEATENMRKNKHFYTLIAKNNIAGVRFGQGRLKDALKMYEEVLEVQEIVLDKDHPNTLITKHNIALIKFKTGDCEDALKRFEEVLAAKIDVLSEEHPSTLSSKHYIGMVKVEQQKYKEAFTIFQTVYASRSKILGENHPKTLETKIEIENVQNKLPN